MDSFAYNGQRLEKKEMSQQQQQGKVKFVRIANREKKK